MGKGMGDTVLPGSWLTSVCSLPLPTSHSVAALEDVDGEEVLLIEDTLSSHTDLMDNESVMYEVRKQFMR